MKSLKLNILSRILCAVLLFCGLVQTSFGGPKSNVIDLSLTKSANCYIVSNAGAAYGLKSNDTGYVGPSTRNECAKGCSVRCIKE